MPEVIALTVRLDPTLKRRMRILAARGDKSLNAWMVEALTDIVEEEEEHEQQARQTSATTAA